MKTYLVCLSLFIVLLGCKKKDTHIIPPPVATVTAFNCTATSVSAAATVGIAYTGIITVPYNGGNGLAYTAGLPVTSTGVTGLTATLMAGTLTNGSGNLIYTVTGMASASGSAGFAVSFNDLSCSATIVVNDAPLVQYGTPFTAVPDSRDAAIYQVNMRAFSNTRNFQGVINRLDSIKALGINVIYLMPTYPVGTLKAINSPYCIRDYKGVNPEFGSLTDLRTLIDGAHNRGMAVIMDWVANHTSWDNSWISTHKDWYVLDGSGNITSPVLGWNDVAQLNYNNAAMRLEMINCMKYWVYTANCDGFRCDYADGPPNDFWKQAIDTLRNIKSHSLLLLAESNTGSKYAAGFDLIYGFNYYASLKSVFNSNVSALTIDNLNTADYTGTVNSQQQVVRYLTNHDVNSSDGTVLSLFGGNTGSMAAFVATAYMKGVPMIYNGQEVGTTFPLPFLTLGNTIIWNQNLTMEADYKNIMAFRNNSMAIKRGQLTSYSNTDICAFTKTQGAETVFVASNFRNSSLAYTLPASVANSTWTNAFTNTSVTAGAQITLPAYGYIVLKK